MLSTKTNLEITEYHEKFFLVLSLRQLACFGVAAVLAIATCFISLTGTVVMIDPVYRELKVMQNSDRKAVSIEKELPVIIPFGDIIELSGEGITNIEDYLGIEKYPDDI